MMKLLMILATWLVLLPTQFAHAIKWKQCNDKIVFGFLKDGKTKGVHVLDWLVIGSTAGSTASTTSYASSTGPCKAFGSLETQRAIYIADSMTDLQQQAAQGQGEHLDTLASLYGCTPSPFNRVVKNNYTSVFAHGDPIFIDQNIQGLVHQDQELVKSCSASLN
jgi:hypothetical protein